MRTMPWIINARHFGFVVCVVLSFGIANAADTPTTTPAAAKVNPAPKKKTGATLQRQQPVAKKYSSSEETLRTALKQQIWLAQHKKPAAAKGNQPGQASKSIAPVSHNASLTPTRTGLRKFTPVQRYGVKPPQPLGASTVRSLPAGGVLQDSARNRAEANVVVSRGASDVRSQEESDGNAGVFLILVALCAAFAGTAAVLYMLSKRAPHRIETKAARPVVPEHPQRRDSVYLAPERKPLERVGTFVDEADEKEHAVVDLAQRYQRGQGEMQLLFSLQAHENGEVPFANLINTSSSPKAKGNVKKHAKKFGLGRGEVDLLRRLQKCSTSATHTQRML